MLGDCRKDPGCGCGDCKDSTLLLLLPASPSIGLVVDDIIRRVKSIGVRRNRHDMYSCVCVFLVSVSTNGPPKMTLEDGASTERRRTDLIGNQDRKFRD